MGDELTQSDISAFERGSREPPLYVLLRYSELARVWVNAFIDDDRDLPKSFPSRAMHEGVRQVSKRRSSPRVKKGNLR